MPAKEPGERNFSIYTPTDRIIAVVTTDDSMTVDNLSVSIGLKIYNG